MNSYSINRKTTTTEKSGVPKHGLIIITHFRSFNYGLVLFSFFLSIEIGAIFKNFRVKCVKITYLRVFLLLQMQLICTTNAGNFIVL